MKHIASRVKWEEGPAFLGLPVSDLRSRISYVTSQIPGLTNQYRLFTYASPTVSLLVTIQHHGPGSGSSSGSRVSQLSALVFMIYLECCSLKHAVLAMVW